MTGPARPGPRGADLPLTRRAVLWRGGALAVVTAGAAWGSLRGVDDHWPFAPMSQFAFRTDPDGEVRAAFVTAVTDAGDAVDVPLTNDSVGMNRAEVEGQLESFRERPERLRALAEAWAALHPGRPRLVRVELHERVTRMEGGRLLDPVEVPVAAWQGR
ncbi:hypothetical protein [Motilibacter aurantiacus]|uniref:hypothetical protein n=1 Tax=Motilibacter aurantiacus TaxID=2714955 RepID=UPI00140DFE64|nr:hypothetical protein [Motilibacter aurantiacus]NHC46080.1 hypothetical protein [Motilibacter aurantiacus]